jgi:hypothetical protein
MGSGGLSICQLAVSSSKIPYRSTMTNKGARVRFMSNEKNFYQKGQGYDA